MPKINWTQKLTSRKFWLALTGFVTAIMYAFNVADVEIERVTSIIMSGSVLIAYILAEGYVDAHRE